jgi:hypothetical protein
MRHQRNTNQLLECGKQLAVQSRLGKNSLAGKQSHSGHLGSMSLQGIELVGYLVYRSFQLYTFGYHKLHIEKAF